MSTSGVCLVTALWGVLTVVDCPRLADSDELDLAHFGQEVGCPRLADCAALLVAFLRMLVGCKVHLLLVVDLVQLRLKMTLQPIDYPRLADSEIRLSELG